MWSESLSPSTASPSPGQADCLWLKAASPYRMSPLGVRQVLTHYNRGIHKETVSGSRGIAVLHLMHTQPKCQTRGSKARSIYKLLHTKGTMSFIIHPQNQFWQMSTRLTRKELYRLLYRLKGIVWHLDIGHPLSTQALNQANRLLNPPSYLPYTRKW